MKTRVLIVVAALFFFTFTLAPAALADTVCESENQSCVLVGGGSGVCSASRVCVPIAKCVAGADCNTPSGAVGICDGSGVCRAGNRTCLAYGPNTGCTTSNGTPGKCDGSNICQPTPPTTITPPVQTTPGTNETLRNPLQGGGNLQSFLLGILDFVIYLGSVIVVLMLVYVGFLFVVARGEPGKLTEARSALLWTVVGALVLLGSKAIALGIQATVNALSAGQ